MTDTLFLQFSDWLSCLYLFVVLWYLHFRSTGSVHQRDLNCQMVLYYSVLCQLMVKRRNFIHHCIRMLLCTLTCCLMSMKVNCLVCYLILVWYTMWDHVWKWVRFIILLLVMSVLKYELVAWSAFEHVICILAYVVP